MEKIGRALVVSIIARAWAALLGLIAVPIYVHFLGVEAYGLVGFFTTIQTLCIFLDLGLGATLTRELARSTVYPDEKGYNRDVARTFEVAYFVVAVLLGAILITASPLVTQHWIRLETLNPEEVSRALVLGGIALAFQWPSSLYSSGMAGLHQQTLLGIATSFFAALRVFVTLGALWLTPDLEGFFLSQVVGALLQSWGMRLLLWHGLALPGHRPSVKLSILKSSMGFAGGMTGITITVILLTQVDKVILSHTLSLVEFGVYVLAGTLAMGIYVAIGPMQAVMFPRFSRLLHEEDEHSVARLYHASAQTMSLLIVPAAIVVAFFSRDALFVWTGDTRLSEQGAPILALLILGNACNGIMTIPYALQLAAGWTTLPFLTNIAALLIFTPAAYMLATKFGAIGGAVTWFSLNLGYLLLTPQLMHRRLLKKEKTVWYTQDVALVIFLSSVAVLPMWVIKHDLTSRLDAISYGLAVWVVAVTLSAVALPIVREFIATKYLEHSRR